MQHKLTKIIATIGPASDSEDAIESLIDSGVNVIRFNFKHNTVDWHSERIERVNKIADKLGRPIGTLIDLQGPELRISMPDESIEIVEGEKIYLGEHIYKIKSKGFTITHPHIIEHLKKGQLIIADDGYFTFEVIEEGKTAIIQSKSKGKLLTNKSINIPGADFPFPVLIERDFEGLKLATRHEIDYIALSFVRSPSDVRTVREEAKKHNVTGKIVSKIETQKAINNIDKIIDASDGIMIARGDLGVELPIEQVPFYQKMIIRKCLIQGRFVITATQILQSMIENPFPTRAEISDIANAVYDKTDAVMLSGETASGAHPIKTVEVMDNTVRFYEQKSIDDVRDKIHFSVRNSTAMIADTGYNLYHQYIKANQNIEGFMVFTQTGRTATNISRYRPKVPIFAFSASKEVCESLSVNYGVVPLHFDFEKSREVSIKELKRARQILQQQNLISKTGKLIVIHGDQWGQGSGATTVRLV